MQHTLHTLHNFTMNIFLIQTAWSRRGERFSKDLILEWSPPLTEKYK
jgi:hypothetical protein